MRGCISGTGTSILLSLTDDIGLSSVVGDGIWKSPINLDRIDKIKMLGMSGVSDNSANNLSRSQTTVGLIISSTVLTLLSTWDNTVRSGVNTNTISLFSSILWIFTERHKTSGLGIGLTSWLRD